MSTEETVNPETTKTSKREAILARVRAQAEKARAIPKPDPISPICHKCSGEHWHCE